MISKKKHRIGKLIALHSMIKHQKRKADGVATFNKDQLDAAVKAIEEVLELDHIVQARNDD